MKLETSYTAHRNVTQSFRKVACSFYTDYKVIYKVILETSNSTSRYIFKKKMKTCSHINLYMNIHSSIIHNSPKVDTTQMTINWWVTKMWCIYTMQYYSTLKENQVPCILQHGWTLVNIMLSKGSQSQRTTCCMIPLIPNVQFRQLIETESSFVTA